MRETEKTLVSVSKTRGHTGNYLNADELTCGFFASSCPFKTSNCCSFSMCLVFTELLLLLSEQEGKHVGQQEVRQESETNAGGGGGGFGVVQQLDIDQGCRMVTRQPIVSSVRGVQALPSLPSRPATLPTQKLFSSICQRVIKKTKRALNDGGRKRVVTARTGLQLCCEGS